jgi:hypothetical protein
LALADVGFTIPANEVQVAQGRTSSCLAVSRRHLSAALRTAAAGLGAKHHGLIIGKFRAIIRA